MAHIGPVLPEGLKLSHGSEGTSDKDSKPVSASIGPQLPPGVTIGPSLPSTSEDSEVTTSIGPAMPIGVSIGPCFPEGLGFSEPGDGEPDEPSSSIVPSIPSGAVFASDVDEEEDEEVGASIGPAIPPGVQLPDVDHDDEDDVVGPELPNCDIERAKDDYALRLAYFKMQKDEEASRPKREEWMTSLPAKLGNYGLGARQFSKSKTGSEQSSEWTETPEQKRRKVEAPEPLSSDKIATFARDREQQRKADALNKSRGKALLDQHSELRPDMTPKQGGRKTFDIEKDMAVRGLGKSTATTEELRTQIGELGARFGHSKGQRFL